MKAKVKILISVFALGVMAGTPLLRAQDTKAPAAEGRKGGKGGGRGGQMSADALVTRLDEAVKLTAEEKTKAHDIYAKMLSDAQAVPQEERRTKGMEIRQAANKDIRALLTPDQQKKFDEMPVPQRGGGKGGKKKD